MRLPVPSNINIRREIWRGLTMRDLMKVVSVMSAAIVCAVLYMKLAHAPNQLAAMIFVVFVGACAFMFYQRLDNFSPSELIKIHRAYRRQQQDYLFKRERRKL